MKNARVITLIAMLFLLAPSPIWAAEEKAPDATLEITKWTVNFVVGTNWGKGVLTVKDGSQYEFSLSGLNIAGIGVRRYKITGEVFDLKDLADFAGHYTGYEVGASLGVGGADVFRIKNDNGVSLALSIDLKGTGFNVGPKGITIVLQDPVE